MKWEDMGWTQCQMMKGPMMSDVGKEKTNDQSTKILKLNIPYLASTYCNDRALLRAHILNEEGVDKLVLVWGERTK